jgi:hypothetical protein
MGQYSVLCVLAIFYPPERCKAVFQMAVSLLQRLALDFSLSPEPVIFLLLGIDVDLLPLVRRRREFTKLACVSSPDGCSTFLSLDSGYHAFRARFSGADLTVLVTSVRQSEWTKDWLRTTHATPVGKVLFTGYYAASFAYLVTLPFRLRILDYFDFFSRFDIDSPLRRDTPTAQGDFFPVRRMIENREFLFGCFISNDYPGVSQNVMNMTNHFFNIQAQHCGKRLHSRAIINNFLSNERLSVPGIFQLFWLGFFSSPELKSFTNTWFTFPEGYKVHRWGDQQYYFRAHALFSIDPSRTMFTDVDAAGCTFYRDPPFNRTEPHLKTGLSFGSDQSRGLVPYRWNQ